MSSQPPTSPVSSLPEGTAPVFTELQARGYHDFVPCAATASMLLYAHGNSVICAPYDTLIIERRFSRHTENVTLLAAHTASEEGGRLVVSCSEEQVAIAWDCLTGDEIGRLESYEALTAVAWMRNGVIALGSDQGTITLFELSESLSISTKTIDEVPITAIAPAQNCTTYAIGYSNGSLLIATLQPRFTILHNLTTSIYPSPVVTLAWHASSIHQNSEMLATQLDDGDLRLWSIEKHPGMNQKGARVIRILDRLEKRLSGRKWMGWSKNGRIIEYSEGKIISWDIRTKKVIREDIQTSSGVEGLTVYGPLATLFTLGPNNMVQQFDLNQPARLVANVQHSFHVPIDEPPDSTAPPTDSGYASTVNVQNKNEHTNEDDGRTVITDGEQLYLPYDEKEAVISNFTSGLYRDVGPLMQYPDAVSIISKALPALLRDFAARVTHTAVEKEHAQAVSFVRQNRNYISASFRTAIESNETEDQAHAHDKVVPFGSSDLISVEEKVNFWKTIPATDLDPPSDEIIQEDKEDSFGPESDHLEKFSKHCELLRESREYQWLLKKIRAAAKLTMRNGTVILDINNKICASLDHITPKGHKNPAPIYGAVFHVALRLRAFLDHYYQDDPCRDIGDVLVLTGCAVNAQAVPCALYMQQIWPDSGIEILRALGKSLANDSAGPYKCRLTDDSQFECVVSETHLFITATGMQPSLVEIGEQLAWLCAALKWSPSSDKMAYSTAQITVLQTPTTEQSESQERTVYYEVSSHLGVLGDNDPGPDTSGSCWHLLFENPVIVQGYPIPARIHNERGLEISMDLMASLGDAYYLTEFNDMPVLKGFSTMFVATEVSDNAVVWHFLCNQDGDRISYLNSQHYCQDYHDSSTFSPFPWTTTRNFVGWATSVNRFAGAPEVNYNEICWSRSNYCSAGCALEKMTLNAGKFVTVGATIGSGMRNHRILHLVKRSYREAVKYARQSIYVNIFDVGGRRGWLLDGASTVLHISRTQLTHDSSPHSGSPALNLEDFHHAHSGSGADAAVDALLDESNMLLEISFDPPEIVIEETTKEDGSTSKEIKKTVKKLLFHELVQRNLSLFEKLHDYQKLLMESDGKDFRRIDREKLEGWDFLEIASGESSLKPRFEILTASGRSWVDFTREIHTINLLGRGFGSLIQPSEDGITLCEGWKQVPKGKDYLATCVSTVDEICRRHGNSQAEPFRLANGIHWHKPHLLFEECCCVPGASTCDRVQVLLPPFSTRIRRPEPFAEGRGGVIFGRSRAFTWTYPNQGTPVRDHFDVQLTANEPQNTGPKMPNGPTPPDSGKGSIANTASNGTEEATAANSVDRPKAPAASSISSPQVLQLPISAVTKSSGSFLGVAEYCRNQRSSIQNSNRLRRATFHWPFPNRTESTKME